MNGTAEHKQAGSRRHSLSGSDSDGEGIGAAKSAAGASRPNGSSGAASLQHHNSMGGVSPPGVDSLGSGGGASEKEKKLNRREKRALKSKNRKIHREHPEFELTYDMMLGIRTVVGNNPTGHVLAPATAWPSSAAAAPASSSATPLGGTAPNGVNSSLAGAQAEAARRRRTREAAEAALADKKSSTKVSMLKLSFPGKGSSLTPAHAMRDFKFKDYCGDVFRDIRARFKIDPTEYLLCVCGNFQYLEFISNSKSGQFFFYSHDRRYMIKTISGGECKFLREILPSYLEHIKSNPHTLLTRFYGMHRVKPHKKKQVHFLIMASCFATQRFVHTVFDLKGSRQGRNATQKEKDSGAAVYKDNDFIDMGITIKLGAERARLLNEQIGRDVEYLRRLNIMDYSLLLGIHYKDRAGDVYGPGGAGGDATSVLGSAGYNGASGSALNSLASPPPGAGAGPAQQQAMSPVTANATREGMAGVTGDELGPGGSGVGSFHAVRVADHMSGEDGDDFKLPTTAAQQQQQHPPHIAEEDEDDGDHEPTHTDGGDEGIYTQLHPRPANAAHGGGAAGLASTGRAGFVSSGGLGDETSHLDPHSHQRLFLDSDLGFIGMTPTHKGTGAGGVQRSPTAASALGRRFDLHTATPSVPAHAHLGHQSLPPTPATASGAVSLGPSLAAAQGSPTPPSPVVHNFSPSPSSPHPHPAAVAEGREGEGGEMSDDAEIEVHFHDETSPRASVAMPHSPVAQARLQKHPSAATSANTASERRPSMDVSSSGLTTPPRPAPLFSGSNDVAAGGVGGGGPSPRVRDLHVAPGSTPTHAQGHGEGGFGSRTWNGQAGNAAAAGPAGGGGGRTTRSQSVLAQQGSLGFGGSGGGMVAQSPTTAAAAAHAAMEAARTKKEMDAAAKLDAIAKQTAYGLPKKYNKVSKPGDIAFPFEFEDHDHHDGAAGTATVGVHSVGSSPVPVYGVAHPHSPRATIGAATMPGPATPFGSLGSPAQKPAATPPQPQLQHPSARPRTAESTPVLQAASTPAGAGVSGPTLDDPALEPLPPSLLPNTSETPLTPSRGQRALSLFASPKEAQSFYAAQRGQGHSGSGPRSLLSPLAAGLSPTGPTPFVLQMPTATGGAAAPSASASTSTVAPASASAAPAATLATASSAPASPAAAASSSHAITVPNQGQGLAAAAAAAASSSPALGAVSAAPASPHQTSGLLSASAHAATSVGSSPHPSPRLSMSILPPGLQGGPFPPDTHMVPYPAAGTGAGPGAAPSAPSSASVHIHTDPTAASRGHAHSSSASIASSSLAAHSSSPASGPPLAAVAAAPDEHKSSPQPQPTQAAATTAGSASAAASSVAPHAEQAQSSLSPSVDPVDPADKLGLFSTDGGCAGQNPDGTPNNELYFMGIIDILTLYNVGKKLENFGKSLKYNEADISAVNPTKYADRFKAFIEHALR